MNDRRGPARSTLNFAIAGWLLVVLVLTLPPNPWQESADQRAIHAVPFEELFRELDEDDPDLLAVVGEMIANLLLLFPLGVLLPLRWASMARLRNILVAAVLFAVAIEGAQFTLGLGRRSSASDVVLNTAGAGLGFIALTLFRRRRRTLAPSPAARSKGTG